MMQRKILDQLMKYLARVIAWFTASTEVWIKRTIKSAAICLTTPATIKVASELYPDDPVLSALVVVAAVILVEGALLLGWHKLDDRSVPSTDSQRWLYAGLAMTAYLALAAVAIYHNEGGVGIVFRLTLLALLIYSIYESGILANIRLQRSADRDITHHRKVRKHRERAEIKVAKLEVDAWELLELTRIMPSYQAKQRGIRGWLQRFIGDNTVTPVKRTGDNKPKSSIVYIPDDLDKQILELFATNPKMATRAVGLQVETSHTTVNKRLKNMERAGIIYRNGRGVEVLTNDR